MTLVDTSVWIDHLRRPRAALVGLLDEGQVACHPFVVGEIALGALRNRTEILGLLADLPAAAMIDHAEVLEMIESRALAGRGIGWVDAHLIASALVTGFSFWTLDRRLDAAARAVDIGWTP